MSQMDVQRLAKKHPVLKPWDIETIVSTFEYVYMCIYIYIFF